MTDTFISDGDEGWRRLGLADIHLRIARTVFDSPEEAQPWAGALTRYAPNSDALRAALSAGISPDQFIAWRAAGVDSWNIVPWSNMLSQAGLTHEHMNEWRLAGHKAPTLPLLVPYMSGDITFDVILDTTDNWNAQGLLSVLESGLDIGEVIRMRRRGVDGGVLGTWSSSGIPAALWEDWMAVDIPPETAASFHARGVDATAASQWLSSGLSSAEAEDMIDRKVSIDTVRQWIEAGASPSDAASFIGAGASLAEAREWMASEMAVSDAVDFVRGGVPLATANEWLENTDLSADDVVDFIQKEVSLEQALEFEERGIGSHQVTRTESGLELDLDPWQVDPADQLPKVIEPGELSITLWTSALGGDPVAHDVYFTWDGEHTADWYEDISMANDDLSFASSSPARGVLAWPNGKDVLLTFNWSDLGLEGHDRLPGMAPTNRGSASDPALWLYLADAILDFVLLDLGSGSRRDERVQYYDTDGWEVEIDEIFRQFLATDAARTQSDFEAWLEEKVAAGCYKISTDE